MRPARPADRAGLAELRLLVGGAGIGVLDTGGQRACIEQRVSQRFGVLAVGRDAKR
jgi:hypothetical protein